ncbi:MAG: hypothetical protein PHW63_05135 [Alphaproteobacteria bacterium]|nr:hypothetical protein [Alphaproteobacteria bacterium]
MTDKSSSLTKLAFVAAAVALLSLSGCATHKGEYRPSIVGPASFGQTQEEVTQKEKDLAKEVKEHKFSEEEKRNIDKLLNDPKYELGGLFRRLRDENGEQIRDFIEGLYFNENGKIYVNFLTKPVHENQIGLINVASTDNVRIKVPVEEAFLVSRQILEEWRDHVEEDVMQGESYMLQKGMAAGAALKAEWRRIQAVEAQEQIRDFLDLRPTRRQRTPNNGIETR